MNTYEKVAESNRIEGILRAPTAEERDEFDRFMALKRVTIEELWRFVHVNQPGATLRDRSGLDVRVGTYYPPRGGTSIPQMLNALLVDVYEGKVTPWDAHVQYEKLHPFTDGNGRSGRMLWYWMMGSVPNVSLGFLHMFYYQTLSKNQ